MATKIELALELKGIAYDAYSAYKSFVDGGPLKIADSVANWTTTATSAIGLLGIGGLGRDAIAFKANEIKFSLSLTELLTESSKPNPDPLVISQALLGVVSSSAGIVGAIPGVPLHIKIGANVIALGADAAKEGVGQLPALLNNLEAAIKSTGESSWSTVPLGQAYEVLVGGAEDSKSTGVAIAEIERISSSGSLAAAVVALPAEPSSRDSTAYIIDVSSNDNSVVVGSGGFVWDAYVVQKSAPTGFSDWNEFKAAVAVSNPKISNLNNIAPGTRIMLPERLADGSITYHFDNGSAINNNAVTGEYYMVVPNADGSGGQTVYSRIADEFGYTVRQIQTDNTGATTFTYEGYQSSLDAVVAPIGASITIHESGTSETINTFSYDDGGRPVPESSRSIDYIDDGSRVEEVTTFTEGQAETLRNTFGPGDALLSSEIITPSASSVSITDQQGVAVLNDIASLIGSIQSGQPLPLLNSGLRLLNTLDNLDSNAANNIPNLGSATALVGGLASLYSLSNALENGDSLTQVNATLSTLNYFNSTLPNLLGQSTISAPLNSFLNGSGGGLINGGAPGVLPALGLVMSIRSGDPVGIATGLIGVINPALLATSPVGWIVAGVQILSALFNEPPESWGTAKIVFDQNGQLKLDSVGEGSGPERVRIQLQGTLDVLNAMLAQAQAGSPNNPLGIVPQRMPSITWREARQDDKGYAITDIDPITGEQRYPYLRWDDTGTPFSSRPDLWQPDPTDPNIRASFNQQLVESALKREAIAAQWEVDTARIQQQVGDPNAGLSETERAAKMGLGATYNEAGEPVGQFRALTVDLDGDGQISTVVKDAAGNDVAFNWDGTGFQKQVAWVQPNDGFLFLDRNLNGVVDSGSELFSNSRVSDNYKGVRSLESVDANRDGKITNVDPVFKELKIWQDVNGDGDNVTVLANGSLTLDPGELQSLTDLGITELDYVNGRLTRDGDYFALRSQQLEADAEGTLVNAVESGIVINYSEGQQQFIISKVTSLVGGADRVDNVFEDGDPFGAPRTTPQEITIPVSLLLANDTIDPVTAATLSVTEVLGAVHGSVRLGDLAGQPAVFFTPEANYNSGMGEDARFEYVVRDGDGATKTVQVTIPLIPVNDLPSVSVQLDQKSIYGYGVLITKQEYSGGEDSYTVVTYSKDRGVPFDAPYRTVIGRQQVGTQTVGWGEDQTEVPVYGDLIDTGIPLDFVQSNFGGAATVVVMDNVRYQIPANPSTVLRATPIEMKAWNDGVVSATDPDGPAAFSYEIVGQGVYGKATIDASTGRFAYTGRRYVEFDEAGNAVYANTDTDKFARYEETFNDVFTVRVRDSSGGYVDQTVTVPHFGPRPNPSVESGGKKPIAIDLDGDGFEFINIDDSNIFLDVNGDGWRRRTAWVGADDGLLAFDENGNGVIDSGLELSFTRFVNGAQSDLEGLRAFDTNKDGVFSAADAQWSQFGVWQDANSNGITDAGEFKSLTDMGIAEIGMTSDGQFRVIHGQTVHGVGNVTKTDGSTLAMADVTLQYTNEVQTAGADGSEQIAQLLTQQNGQSFSGTTDKDLVFGTGGSDNISTGDADDAIVDDAGDDVIDAGAGNDLIFSGMGNDVVLAGNGDDSVFTGEGNDAVFGDAEGGHGNDLIMLAGGNDVAFGGAGNDFIGGGTGNDILSGDAGDDKLFGEDGWDALMGGAGNDELWGMTGNDYLEGGDGNDLLAGGAGVDVMQGGAGDDTYEVDNLADIVDETVGGTVDGLPGTGDAGGIDTVRSAVDYTLGALLENLTLTGETQLTGTGNAKDNVLIGNAASNTLMGLDGNDLLDGAAGADTLVGGQGDDTYVIDNAGDQVVEAAGEGVDTVRSRISAALSANVENLTLIGINAINGTGNELDNRIIGNAAANVIDGGAGNDQMSGGQGDDVYLVDSAGDIVSEAQGQGIDAVRSSVDYALTANVEDLELVGSAVSALGNDLANRIFGNAQDNLIDGGVGADVMAGRLGNDLYQVDNSQDVIVEAAGEGLDQVVASESYTLSDNVENLTLIGDAVEGTGNALSNTLKANATDSILRGLGGDDVLIGDQGNDELSGGEGADRLDGQAGDDLLLGGQGNDSYVVESAGDVVVEEAGQGLDDVTSSVDYTLTANVENLQLVGAATAGTGNDLGNRLLANDLGNELSGLAGGDELIGGAGADRLLGGEGNDFLAGNNGADLLDGGAGQDLMQGGMGDDHYIVDNAADVVEEADCGLLTDIPNAGVPVALAFMVTDTGLIEDTNGSLNAACGGIDTVTSTVDYTLTRNVENLILVGSALVGTGNELNNDITGNDSGNTLSGLEGNDHLRAGTGNDVLLGGTGQDVLVANSGNDLLDGGVGDDLMIGGLGDDVYRVDSAGDVVVEETNAGHDKVLSAVDYALTAQVEDLELVGAATTGVGNELANVIRANAVDSNLYGVDGDDTLLGSNGNDTLSGGAGNDALDGGAGADAMAGGSGDDSYFVDQSGDAVVELAQDGYDTVTSEINYVLPEHVERLILSGQATQGTGNELANTIIANDLGNTLSGLAGDDVLLGASGDDALLGGTGDDTLSGGAGDDALNGGAGVDAMAGGSGDDSYFVDQSGDAVVELAQDGYDTVTSEINYVLPEHVEQLILSGSATQGTGNELANTIFANDLGNVLSGLSGDDVLVGGTGDDTLLGGIGNDLLKGSAGDDLLDGGQGSDAMAGGSGDDSYVVEQSGDVVVELALEGYDTVTSEINYVLPEHVERLILSGSATQGTGNELANTIIANDLGNTLEGLAGDDVLLGGSGDDTLLGGTGDDTLSGGVGADALNGGAGADAMAGGSGDDSYSVDQSGDAVVELAQGGYDTVTSEINFVLPEHVERLILSGLATQGTGNELANTIIANELGNTLEGLAGDDVLAGGSGDDTLLGGTENDTLNGGAGADALDGGTGADAMAGGTGDDSYVVDDAGDLVTEYAHEGYDQVSSSINYVLPEHVEKLVLSGPAQNGTGNSLSNHLVGNGLANILDGALGADLLEGAGGDDRYVVDNVGDIVSERLGEGNDTVFTSVDYALSANVENMVLSGVAVSATGNDLNNTLVGNTLANTLTGGAGNDVLAGGLGNDVLMGGVGNDTYLWNQGDGRDVITDTSGVDGVRFGAGITLNSLSAREYTVNGQRRVFISVLDADGEERADQGIEFALDATTVIRTIYDRRGRPIGTESETTYSSPVESFVLTDGTVFTLDQLKPSVVLSSGTWGNDTLTGSRADDQMDGWLGNDTLYGRSGNDTLIGGNGRDRLFGEGGHDQLLGGNDDDYLQGGTGNDLLDGDNGRDVLLGGAGNDNLSGGNDSDILDGGTGQDQLSGGNGEDELWAGAGDDQLSGGNDSDLLAGGAGNDLLDGGNGADVIVAGDGHDTILAGHDSDFIDAGAGDDQIDAGYGNDFIVAGKGNDRITAGSGTDVIAFNRGDGADVLTADTWQQDAISLGGGIRHTDLSLTRQGNDLVLGLGQGDQITLQGWYLGSFGSGESISRLQIVNAADGGSYNASSTDRLINREVTVFDFREFVESFDRNEHCGTNGVWSADAALRSAYLYGSNSQAIGGDLAFSYAMDSADQAGSATYGTDGWKDARNQMFAMGNYMQTLCAQPINTVTPWAAMQAGTSLIVEVPTGASMPIDIKPSLTQDQLVTQALNTQQQLSGQPRPSWV